MKRLLPKKPILDSVITAIAEKEKKLVIQIANGGLGDHLLYSSLPELLWKQKGIKTVISNKSVFRSQAIFDFVWKLNPYVEFTDEKGWFVYRSPLDDCLTVDQYLQKLFDLDGNGCPKIYYEPCLIEELKGKTIVDPSCGAAGKANGYFEHEFYERYIQYLKQNVGDFVLVIHDHTGHTNILEKQLIKRFKPVCCSVSTIQQLCDVLCSASKRYLLHTGVASISASLNLESIVLNYHEPSSYTNFLYKINKHVNLKRIKESV